MINREDLKSIKFITENSITKSLFDDIGFERSLLLHFSGKEIREKIMSVMVEKIISKNGLTTKLDSLIKEIGELPNYKMEDYELKGMRSKLQSIPLKYSYDSIYLNDQDNKLIQSDQGNKKEEYNRELYKFIELSIDCLVLKTILDNLKDDFQYSLNPQLATKLGL